MWFTIYSFEKNYTHKRGLNFSREFGTPKRVMFLDFVPHGVEGFYRNIIKKKDAEQFALANMRSALALISHS